MNSQLTSEGFHCPFRLEIHLPYCFLSSFLHVVIYFQEQFNWKHKGHKLISPPIAYNRHLMVKSEVEFHLIQLAMDAMKHFLVHYLHFGRNWSIYLEYCTLTTFSTIEYPSKLQSCSSYPKAFQKLVLFCGSLELSILSCSSTHARA